MYFAVVATAIVTAVVKLTPAGRRFEAVGANSRRPGRRAPRQAPPHGAYVWAQVLYCLAAVLLAGIVNKPTAYEGDNYLLPSVAAVVLGGTSLLGGRGNLVATAVAALFLSQLDQFVLALGVTYATRTLVRRRRSLSASRSTPSTGAGSHDACSARRPTSLAPT